MKEEKEETPTAVEKKEKKERPRYEVVTVDIFQKLLGYNYHLYGTKRKSL